MFDFFSHPQHVLHLSSRVLGTGLAMLEAYVLAHSPIAPPLTNRIQRAP